MKLSLVFPAYNEAASIMDTLNRWTDYCRAKNIDHEIVVVDDGSQDATKSKIESYIKKNKSNIVVISYAKNQGKGAAVKTGIAKATGDYIVIQDADLEYNPEDIKKLIDELGNTTDKVVYGTRLKRMPHFSAEERRMRFMIHYLGNKFLSLLTSVLYGQWITDMETCYKLFPKKAVEGMVIHARGFEFEPEITAKLKKRGYIILEVPITTKPRGYEEGKKLNTITDGIKALKTLIVYRFTD